ncbi:MAG: hypothetical protein R6X10_01300 [Desulfobacterales bacterium]
MKRFLQISLFSIYIFFLPSNLMAVSMMIEADKAYDKAYETRNTVEYRKAIQLYKKIAEANPMSYEAQWKYSRVLQAYGYQLQASQIDENSLSKIIGLAKIGMRSGQKSIEINPNGVEGYYYYSSSLGLYSDRVSVITAIIEGLKNKAQNALERAYELDKTYDHAGPIQSLARFWAVLPWPLRDTEKALKLYREYIKINNQFYERESGPIMFAELLISLGGDKNIAEAKSMLQTVLKITKEKFYQDWGKRLIEEIG